MARVVGVLGRSLEISPLELVALCVVSTHYHMLAVVHDQQQLSRFMQHFQGNLSRELGRLIGWRGPLWSRRYDGIVVSDEPKVHFHFSKRLKLGDVQYVCAIRLCNTSGCNTSGTFKEELQYIWHV